MSPTPATLTARAAASSSSAASGSVSAGGGNLKIVGIVLAIVSGLLIGSSFVFKKKGLLRSQAGQVAGEGVAYLKSPLWWTGMTMMILGELCNFAAYAFIEALVVTPLGALSVVICAILSSIFLNEKLTFFGWLGCGLCIIGSVIIALNGPQEQTVGQITEFQKLFLSPGFLVYGGVLIAASLVIIFYFAPKHGKKSMLWYIAVCSMIGGISVSVTTGLGAAIVTTAQGDNQFKHWFMYFLIVFVAVTLITEVYYLNMALAIFNTAMVTPTYYVIFTFCSMVTTVVLFQGLKSTAVQIITVVMGFLTICLGITILQMSKVDPVHLQKLDRRSTMLLQANRNPTENEEKSLAGQEDPGLDALRGSFGTVGSIIRARSARRMSMSMARRPTGASTLSRPGLDERPSFANPGLPSNPASGLDGVKRHQLWDAPMPSPGDRSERISMKSQNSFGFPSTPDSGSARKPTIKFGSQDLVHQYDPTGKGNAAIHERREAQGEMTPRATAADQMRQAQVVTSPTPMGREEIQTAPIIANSRFFNPQTTDPFGDNKPPATAPLGSYPSASDSIGSQAEAPWYQSDEEVDRERDRRAHGKHYPRGTDQDDREESMRLYHRPSVDDSVESLPEAGVRLVPGATSSGSRF